MNSKSGALTLDGGNYSLTEKNTSATSKKPRNASTLMETKMKKDERSKFITETMESIRNGRSSILMNPRRLKLRERVENSVLKSTEHSTLSLDYQCTELLNVTEPTTFGLRDIERMLLHNSSSSTMSPRLSDHNNGRTMPWKSNQTEDHPTSDLHQASLQDGGRCSECKEHTLLTIKERSWTFQVPKILKTETSKSGKRTLILVNNGMSSMLMNTQRSQRRENSMNSSVSMLIETSTLCRTCLTIDTSI